MATTNLEAGDGQGIARGRMRTSIPQQSQIQTQSTSSSQV